MNDVIQCGVLQVEAKQLLRYRVPLLLAVLVNGVLIARIPVAAMLGQSPASSTAMTGQVGPGPGQSDDASSGDSRTDGNAAANESDANDPQRDASASSTAAAEMVSSTIEQPGTEDGGDMSSVPLADGADAVQEMPSAPSSAFDRVADETVATGENGLDASDLLRTTHGFTRDAGQVMERFLAGLDHWGARCAIGRLWKCPTTTRAGRARRA